MSIRMKSFATQRLLFNGIKKSISNRFSTFSGSTLLLPRVTARATGLTLATSFGIAAPWIYNSKNLIYNDALLEVDRKSALSQKVDFSGEAPVKRTSRLNGKLDYRQLCIGSICGLVLGVVVGKISMLLVYFTGVGLLTLQWLQNRDIINKNATTNLFAKYIIRSGKETIDLNTLIWERPSFKISFLLTFILAAANI